MPAYCPAVEQRPEMQSGKLTPGATDADCAVLRAVINVLCQHADVSHYCVNWRGALFGLTCRSETA